MKVKFNQNDTLIHIDVQAEDKAEILTCVKESFVYMPEWTFDNLVTIANPDSRFYTFNLSIRKFYWWRDNDTLSDTQDEDETPIRDLADISHLLEFIYLNGETLRAKPEKKGFDIKELYKKLLESGAGFAMKSSPLTPSYPKWEDEWSYTPYEYSDGNGGKSMFAHKMIAKMAKAAEEMKAANDLTPHIFQQYSWNVEHSNSVGELIGILNKIAGLHGPKATQLKEFITVKIDGLKKEQMKNANWMDGNKYGKAWTSIPAGEHAKIQFSPKAFWKNSEGEHF